MNHGLKYESDFVSIGIGIEIWIVEGFAKECFIEFLSSTQQSNRNIFSVPEQVFIPAVSHMKIANVHVGTLYTKTWVSLCNFHTSLQLSCQFAIFISVCNSHVSVFSSYVDVCNFHMSLQFSYQFVIFISVCNSHVTRTPALTYVALDGFYVTRYDLELINSTSVMVLPMEDKDKLELSKIDYYLLLKSF